MDPPRRRLFVLALALGVAGCGTATPTTSSTSPALQSATSPGARQATSGAPAMHYAARHGRNRPSPSRPSSSLQYSSAPADQVQTQPAPGTCHASGPALYSLPDPRCTPGALNPAVTQATIGRTVCMSDYTKTIRPVESITEPEKQASMAAYGDTASMSSYEYDHLVSLELGGAANDPRNLWPEPGTSPNPKDSVEDELHRMVCDGQMPLTQAQRIIATDWVGWARSHGDTSVSTAPPAPSPSSPAPAPSSGPVTTGGRVHCRDFATHAAAQRWFEAHGGSDSHDVDGLDGNHNGIACEDLP